MAEFLSLNEAVKKNLNEGEAVCFEGFTHLIPHASAHEVIRQRIKDLTIIRMTPDVIYDQLIGSGLVKKMIFSYAGNPGVGLLRRFRDSLENGWPNKIDIEEEIIKEEENKEDIIISKTVTASEIVDENIQVNTDKNDNDVLDKENPTEELKKSVPSATTHEKITTSPNIKSKQIGFGEAINTCIKKYFDFSGRARRSEYWYFVLFNCLVFTGLLILSLPEVFGIFYLFVFIPSISVLVRRLHDTGKSGWWILISFIPFLNIVLFIFTLMDSESKTNKWGKNPKF